MRPVVFLAENIPDLRSKKKLAVCSTMSSSDFPLLLRVTNQNNSAMYRIGWMVALGLCWALSIYQILDRLVFYLSTPIRTSVTTYRNETIIYPMMTACTLTTSGEQILRKIYANNSGKTLCNSDNSYYSKNYGNVLNMSYTTIMKRINISEDFKEYCSLDVRTLNDYGPGGYKYWCKVTWSDSFVGSCMTLTSRFPAIYSRHNRFSIKAWPSEEECSTAHLKLLIHQDMIDVISSSINDEEFIHLDLLPYVRERIPLSVSEFRYMDTPKNPCTDDETYQRCVKEYVRKGIEAANLSCTFPFLGPSKLTVCNNWNDLYRAHMVLQIKFYNRKIPCTRRCHEIIFRRNYSQKIKALADLYTITLEYLDNLVSVSEEYYAYSFVSLVCDVGGNVGLCLGLCLISLLETLELCSRRLVACTKQKMKMNRCVSKIKVCK